MDSGALQSLLGFFQQGEKSVFANARGMAYAMQASLLAKLRIEGQIEQSNKKQLIGSVIVEDGFKGTITNAKS